MYKKLCEKCHQPSFSSSELGVWFCPVCENDLTHARLYEAEVKIVRPFTGFKTINKPDIARTSSKIDITI